MNMDVSEGEKNFSFEMKVFPLDGKKLIWIGKLTADGEVFSVPIESVYYTQNNIFNPDLKS